MALTPLCVYCNWQMLAVHDRVSGYIKGTYALKLGDSGKKLKSIRCIFVFDLICHCIVNLLRHS